MRHLTPADYRRMPWANGRGTTVEILRIEGPDGGLLLRLSMASVIEDGPFSVIPGIERSLTVISGPGFRLEGEGIALDCHPLKPVTFPGDVPVQAVGTGGWASEDFNVMTARHLPKPEVRVLRQGERMEAGGQFYVLALGVATVNGSTMGERDLIETEHAIEVGSGDPVIAVRASL